MLSMCWSKKRWLCLYVCMFVVMCWWELMPRQKAVGLQDGGIGLYKTSNAKGKE